MGTDEIRGGAHDNRPRRGSGLRSARVPGRVRAGLGVAALAVVVVLALQSVLGAGPTPGPAPGAPQPPPPTPAALAADLPAASPPRRAVAGRDVSVLAVCSLGTDHRRRLAVRFLLINETPEPLRVLSVRPWLPLGGLRPDGTSMVRGDCYRWDPGGVDDVLPPAGSLAVTMAFRLPRACPWPLPVQARVRVQGPGGVRAQTLSLLADLGGTAFDSCPTDLTPSSLPAP